MIVFPSVLPAVLLSALSMREVSHVRSNEVQSGPPLFELMTSDTPLNVSVSWNFSKLEYKVFEGWFKWRCRFGAESFGLLLPVGAGLLLHECFFTDSFTVARSGKRVIVSAELVAVNRIYDTEADFEFSLILAELAPFSDEFNIFAETYLPDTWEDIL